MKPAVDVRLLRCEECARFAKEFVAALQDGFTVHSSGMVTEVNSEYKGSNGEYYTSQWSQDVWWAICTKEMK